MFVIINSGYYSRSFGKQNLHFITVTKNFHVINKYKQK